MNWQDAALLAAGMIGSIVAVIHGILTQRLMVRPLQESGSTKQPKLVKMLVPPLLQFSTFNWFLGGLALIASIWFEPDVKLAIGLLVGSSFLFAAIVALWASRGRHPGGLLYAVAVILIVFGINL
ncbi:hypothetical protein [Paenibacillus agilis]|uniref:DUF1304 domain-containing protein n=1 Tax=Paenibacillus agilis TaxID=3020863 RepID=A0A559IXM3_9BACL|nr:hypothetical protein [Paenibacillus agilis]TVX92390.1 hypothetical protein FPZ44_04525 [Paenibacillus agilis]